jgi:hypothetical protein
MASVESLACAWLGEEYGWLFPLLLPGDLLFECLAGEGANNLGKENEDVVGCLILKDKLGSELAYF